VALGVLSVVGSGSSGPGAQTLYRNASGPITAFAADGSVLAWFAPGGHSCNAVHVLSLTGVKVTLPKPGTRNVTCRWSVGDGPVALAIAQSADGALWTLHERTEVVLDYVVGADASQPRERRFDQLAHTRAGAGLWLGGIAGSGSTLVYAATAVAYVNQVACLSGGSCRLKLAGGAIHRVVGRDNPVIRNTGPAVAVATAAGLIAYIPARSVGSDGRPLAGRSSIPVRSAQTGALVARIEPGGLPLGLALAPHVLVLLDRSAGEKRIDWYDAERGTRLGSVRVPRATSARIAASDRLIVYRVGNVLHAVDVRGNGPPRRLWKASTKPVGLSVKGTRVFWAENPGGKGRIRSLVAGA
jgi:hypothetical protein